MTRDPERPIPRPATSTHRSPRRHADHTHDVFQQNNHRMQHLQVLRGATHSRDRADAAVRAGGHAALSYARDHDRPARCGAPPRAPGPAGTAGDRRVDRAGRGGRRRRLRGGGADRVRRVPGDAHAAEPRRRPVGTDQQLPLPHPGDRGTVPQRGRDGGPCGGRTAARRAGAHPAARRHRSAVAAARRRAHRGGPRGGGHRADRRSGHRAAAARRRQALHRRHRRRPAWRRRSTDGADPALLQLDPATAARLGGTVDVLGAEAAGERSSPSCSSPPARRRSCRATSGSATRTPTRCRWLSSAR